MGRGDTMINTNKTFAGKSIAYEILEDGYMIYLDNKPWISQQGIYAKPMDKSKSYEENCLAQIEELTREPEPQEQLYTLDQAANLLAQEVSNE
jgi:hypothetical protein